MTVKELFDKLTFDEVIAALRNTHRNDNSIKCVESYKMAFDLIRHIDFKGDGGEVTFDVSPRNEWFSPGSLPMVANNVEGKHWKNTVGKKVVFPENNPFTDAEIAGAILWGMTFYGFDPEEASIFDFDEECNSGYGIKAQELEQRIHRPYERKSMFLDNIMRNQQEINDMCAYLDIISYRMKHQNRIKRMRLHRIEKRIEYLEEMDKWVGKLKQIQSLLGEERTSQLKNSIMNAEGIDEYNLKSRAYDSISRIEYLIDLADNYTHAPGLWSGHSDCNEAIAIITTSAKTPASDEETLSILKYFRQKTEQHGLHLNLNFGNDDTPEKQMQWQIILIKNKLENGKKRKNKVNY